MRHLGYTALDPRSLPPDLPLICNLYIRESGRYVLYREALWPFTKADREWLLASGVDALWIHTSPADELSPQHLITLFNLPDEQVPPVAKAGLLYGSAMAVVRQATASSVSRKTLGDVSELLSLTLSYLACSPTCFATLLSVMRNDFSVYTHAVNVAVYALALGRFIGITDEQELRTLGLGAVLHDVGKARVPSEVLNKAGPLSPEEWTVMRRHPVWGKELLSVVDDLPRVVLSMVAQHHERLDGSGYPEGIAGQNLHQFSKLVAIVDAYDAVTCHRPYRPPHTRYIALSILKKETVGELDPDLFTSFVHLLSSSNRS